MSILPSRSSVRPFYWNPPKWPADSFHRFRRASSNEARRFSEQPLPLSGTSRPTPRPKNETLKHSVAVSSYPPSTRSQTHSTYSVRRRGGWTGSHPVGLRGSHTIPILHPYASNPNGLVYWLTAVQDFTRPGLHAMVRSSPVLGFRSRSVGARDQSSGSLFMGQKPKTTLPVVASTCST